MNNFFKYAVVVIILLSLLPLGYQYLNVGMTADELFVDNFTTHKIIDSKKHRGLESEAENTIAEVDAAAILAVRSKAILAYNKKNYSEATKYFKAYMTTTAKTKDKGEVELYLGLAYLGDNQTTKAKNLFKKMSKRGSKGRKQDAEWYLVLTLLKENNVEQAKKNLAKILHQKRAHTHKEKALKLQQQIDKYYVQ
ncbi:tetratricopeptide repeat protein [Aureispira anguillae]|uniref:Tetratricopeptide repeat-containing protein n=1 Tax=Aureispira anguillae TaxID=2864201 RepID=A0A916DW17_9BACT|nr:hypothetical protein [Aureispira anguillae]BDS13631.1 hypothetical protein AsAng_0043700 [Aureispira anguillae]